MSRLVVHGARLLDEQRDVADGWLVAEDGVIVATGDQDGAWQALGHHADVVLDAAGGTLTPGFIDLHGHGGGGGSFDQGADAVAAALSVHRTHGTTRSVLSLVTNPIPVLCRALSRIAEVTRTDATVLGAHLEGPFLAPDRHGAHDVSCLMPPRPEAIDPLLAAADGTLRQITLAPELPGGLDAVRRLSAAGVVVALGHTETGYELAGEAFAAGATLLTHAFNAMPGLHHRDPGPVAAAIDAPSAVLELITDGVHVHPRLVHLLFGLAPGRVALVTDAMAAAGAGDGAYRLGALDVVVRQGRAMVSGSETLAGSTLTQDAALRYAVEVAGVEPREAVGALTATPARVLGLGERFGRLAAGCVADLVLLDGAWRAQRVWIAGRPL